ncbi:unnamed protein product [Nesidiocoris tenuis]|uniref:CDP-diacylglycerol--glycerol-3-phosphate 3-phosphatidyltransferase n=1 Tax=Nesidiocoris tenuis TaxID=355587 RepID=A0A6H5GJ90_9HEMI|nr:unnamed protein product [Nesidiocoris tenuis]
MIRGAIHALEKAIEGSYQLPGSFSWLQSSAPMFSLKGDQVKIIHHPNDFYETLVGECQKAKKRIMLASLYLGTGPLEKKLVEAIQTRLGEKDELEVMVLLDANRGSRGRVNSRTMLLPLLQTSPNCQVMTRGFSRFWNCPPLNVHRDSTVTLKLLEDFDMDSHVILSTGYFNLTDQYSQTILERSKAQFKILMAHPSTNGFLKASGLAGGIPGAYTGLALSFLDRVLAYNQTGRISMYEYIRAGWTYHAKGLWYYPPQESRPIMTLVGSSNFGSRSVQRDLETQLAIVTVSEDLRNRLRDEEQSFSTLAQPFTRQIALSPDRKPKLWVYTTMKLFKTFF